MRRALSHATVCSLAAVATAAVPSWVCITSAAAATLKVTTTADELGAQGQKCSLREAIAAVDSPGRKSVCGVAGPASNTIVLGAGRYELSIAPQGKDGNASGDLDVTGRARLTIVGGGKARHRDRRHRSR